MSSASFMKSINTKILSGWEAVLEKTSFPELQASMCHSPLLTYWTFRMKRHSSDQLMLEMPWQKLDPTKMSTSWLLDPRHFKKSPQEKTMPKLKWSQNLLKSYLSLSRRKSQILTNRTWQLPELLFLVAEVSRANKISQSFTILQMHSVTLQSALHVLL